MWKKKKITYSFDLLNINFIFSSYYYNVLNYLLSNLRFNPDYIEYRKDNQTTSKILTIRK